MKLTDNAKKVFEKRYAIIKKDGKLEEPAEVPWRVANAVVDGAQKRNPRYKDSQAQRLKQEYAQLMDDLDFLPNSPTFTGAGTPLGQLAACMVLPIADDMGKEPDGIFSTLRNAALVQQTGGGNGFSFSRLRPKGSRVSRSNGVATGPVGFMKVYNAAFGEIAQGGVRRGANLAALDVSHPDIEEFIDCKTVEGELSNFNISVAITDEFMRKAIGRQDFELVFDGKVYKTVNAHDLLTKIAVNAHRNGEPGMIFIDEMNRNNPMKHLYKIETTNPCWTGDTKVLTLEGQVRFDKLAESGEDIEVYTMDDSGKLLVRTMRNPRMTSKSEEILGIILDNNEVLRCTANHGIYLVDGSLVEAKDLKSGDSLRCQYDDLSITVVSVFPTGETEAVYNGTVDDVHRYFVMTGENAAILSKNCGEQALGPYENCCLGSINLANHVYKGTINWEKLKKTVKLSTAFLDDVIDANKYVPGVPQIEEAALRARRIGLGIMGWADMLFAMNIRYGSNQSIELAGLVMEWIQYWAMDESIGRAKEYGKYPGFNPRSGREIEYQYLSSPRPLCERYNRPFVSWHAHSQAYRLVGIRNATLTTIAPTGTISTVAGLEGYGCEPAFALAYVRHVKETEGNMDLWYVSPALEEALEKSSLKGDEMKEMMDYVMKNGTLYGFVSMNDTCQSIANTFVTSGDIPANEHIAMQAAFQKYVDNSISKTINMPATASPGDVRAAYLNAWKSKCRGITVYVTGSRDSVVLETKKVEEPAKSVTHDYSQAEKSEDIYISLDPKMTFEEPVSQQETYPSLLAGTHNEIQSRPTMLSGNTYREKTPVGQVYVTINGDDNRDPFEVFITVGKAGSEISAVSEAFGRVISLFLRSPSKLSPRKRLKMVAEELNGIGGSRSVGFGPNRVSSLPDGIARILKSHAAVYVRKEQSFGMSKLRLMRALESASSANDKLLKEAMEKSAEKMAVENEKRVLAALLDGKVTTTSDRTGMIGDICPECGNASFLNIEGCRKCASCGYSEC